MKKCLFGLAIVSTFFYSASQAVDQNGETVIYKFIQDGVVMYAHILPDNVTDYIKLDAEGFEILELPEESVVNFDAIVRPGTQSTEVKEKPVADKKVVELSKEEEAINTINQKNCEIAQENMKRLEGQQGQQVFDVTPTGVKVIEGKDLEDRRAKAKKDVEYFCSDASAPQ